MYPLIADRPQFSLVYQVADVIAALSNILSDLVPCDLNGNLDILVIL